MKNTKDAPTELLKKDIEDIEDIEERIKLIDADLESGARRFSYLNGEELVSFLGFDPYDLMVDASTNEHDPEDKDCDNQVSWDYSSFDDLILEYENSDLAELFIYFLDHLDMGSSQWLTHDPEIKVLRNYLSLIKDEEMDEIDQFSKSEESEALIDLDWHAGMEDSDTPWSELDLNDIQSTWKEVFKEIYDEYCDTFRYAYDYNQDPEKKFKSPPSLIDPGNGHINCSGEVRFKLPGSKNIYLSCEANSYGDGVSDLSGPY